jgi:putative protein kinase ArgK-like GTPase of G3E family
MDIGHNIQLERNDLEVSDVLVVAGIKISAVKIVMENIISMTMDILRKKHMSEWRCHVTTCSCVTAITGGVRRLWARASRAEGGPI